MSLPRVLAVDDSIAVLAYMQAALCEHYDVTTVDNGTDALRLAKDLAPEIVLLDLSMPKMTGDEVLARLKEDPQLRAIPVVIVSSERRRGEECLKHGAAGFMSKPVRAPELRALVERILSEQRALRQRTGLSVLPVQVGSVELGLLLDCVVDVAMQPLTRALAGGPPYMREIVDFHGQPLAVVDVAVRLGVQASAAFEDRMLVVVEHAGTQLALRVDSIGEPQTYGPDELVTKDAFGGSAHPPLEAFLRGVVRAARGPLPVVDASMFLSPEQLAILAEGLVGGAVAQP